MANLIRRQMPWTLQCVDGLHVDQELCYIEGILPPSEPEESGEAGVYASIGIPGRKLPLTQYVRGEEQTFSFQAFFINDPSVGGGPNGDGRRVTSHYRRILKRAARPVVALGLRPPKYLFQWGRDLFFECFVEAIGAITYSSALDGDGDQHTATFSIVLRIIESEDEFEVGPQFAREPASRPVVKGETYETIADAAYNDPMLGVALRQQSKVAFPDPDNVEIQEGIPLRVKLLDPTLLKKFGIAPVSVALQLQRGDVSAAVDSLYSARGRSFAPGALATTPIEQQIPFLPAVL
jgi:hypothetical protein